MKRREFCWSALALSAPARLLSAAAPGVAEDPIITSLRSSYASLSSYVDVVHAGSEGMGRSWVGEIRTAFVRPNRLCSQVTLLGKTEITLIIDGDSSKQWSSKKGWQDLRTMSTALAGLRGSNRFYGYIGHLTALLLLGEASGEEPALSTMTNITCTQKQEKCLAWQGKQKDSERSFTLDPANGLIRRFTCVDPYIKAAGLIDSRANTTLDMDAVIAALTRAPDQSMPVMQIS